MKENTPASKKRDAQPQGAQTAAVSVLLTNDQIAQLDEISAAVRRTSGSSVSRSALIRAMTDAALTLRNDWDLCREEDHFCLFILARLSSTTVDRRGAEQKLRRIKPGSKACFDYSPDAEGHRA